jgi:F0F1-type ATP synthase gamma subunit
MAAPNPKKWFPWRYVARISLRKVDKWSERMSSSQPYFDSWEEARDHMHRKATQRVRVANDELQAARRHLLKVEGLKPPGEKRDG